MRYQNNPCPLDLNLWHSTFSMALVKGMTMKTLKKLNGEEIVVVCGGVIPREDYDFLKKIGVKAIFGPGTNILDAAKDLIDILLKK